MRRLFKCIAVPVILLPHSIEARQSAGSLPASSEDLSFYVGKPVMHPEALSGIWETSNGRAGAVGIHLKLDTTLPADARSWTPQSWQTLELGVFERQGAEIQLGEGYFSDSIRSMLAGFELFIEASSGRSIVIKRRKPTEGVNPGWALGK